MRPTNTPVALLAIGLAFTSAGSVGCSTKPPPPAPPSALELTQSAQFDVAPRQLVQEIEAAVAEPPLSLGVERAEGGVVVTGYEPFPGEWHVLRRWQERTRYRIAVVPDWNDPAARARVEVTPETQQRASDQHQWTPAPELHRPQRAQAILRHIERRLNGGGGTGGRCG